MSSWHKELSSWTIWKKDADMMTQQLWNTLVYAFPINQDILWYNNTTIKTKKLTLILYYYLLGIELYLLKKICLSTSTSEYFIWEWRHRK